MWSNGELLDKLYLSFKDKAEFAEKHLKSIRQRDHTEKELGYCAGLLAGYTTILAILDYYKREVADEGRNVRNTQLYHVAEQVQGKA